MEVQVNQEKTRNDNIILEVIIKFKISLIYNRISLQKKYQKNYVILSSQGIRHNQIINQSMHNIYQRLFDQQSKNYCLQLHLLSSKIFVMSLESGSNQNKILFIQSGNRKEIGCHLKFNQSDEKSYKKCRICQMNEEFSKFISPCNCDGNVHEECLKLWILQNDIEKVLNKNAKYQQVSCEICHFKMNMDITIKDTFLCSRSFKVSNYRKLCWTFQLFILLVLLIGGIVYVLKSGGTNIISDAILILFVIIIITMICQAIEFVIDYYRTQVIVEWRIHNMDKSEIRLDIKSIEQNKQQKESLNTQYNSKIKSLIILMRQLYAKQQIYDVDEN